MCLSTVIYFVGHFLVLSRKAKENIKLKKKKKANSETVKLVVPQSVFQST